MTREEHDLLGSMNIPDEQYYGIQTMRGLELSVSGRSVSEDAPLLIYYLAAVKKAAAMANQEIGALDDKSGKAIVSACEEIMSLGHMMDQFPVDMFQGGGGISIHMNVNEVIANRANEIILGQKGYAAVHPNTHVNMGQSTNDVLPAAMQLAFHAVLKDLAQQVKLLWREMSAKAEEFKDIVKIGRTCLQDALPVTLGQEFAGYASFLGRQISSLEAVAETCLYIPLGATAVGTGIGTMPGFVQKAYTYLNDITGLNVRKSDNFFDSLQIDDIYVKISAAFKALAVGLSKIATDFRLMSSGPHAGFNEIELPPLQPGSSIMPGKINPVLPELMNQVCYQVCGNDAAVTMAVEGGELDLNVWEAIIMKCLFESSTLLIRSIPLFAYKCVQGIKANTEICRAYAEGSTAVSALVSAVFGYEIGAKVAKKAINAHKTVREVVVEDGLLDPESADLLLDPMNMTDSTKMEYYVAKFHTMYKTQI